MRIATFNAFEAGIDTLQKRQQQLADSQERLTSGKRVIKASDDPAAAARAERAIAGQLRSDTSQRAVDASKNAMTLTESALGDAGELLQEARKALVAAGNGSYSDQERKGLATQLAGIRSQLLAVANRGDGAGNYLFAGQGTTVAPFLDAPGGVTYQAVAGEQRTEAGTNLPLSLDGKAMWLQARTGNGVFETSAAAGVTGAWIDNGQVVDPSAVTGSTYTLQFTAGAGGTTYAVMKDGLPTAVTAAPYTSGQNIVVDGMSVKVSGTPATGDSFTMAPSNSSLSVFGVLDRAIASLNTPGRTNAQIQQANTDGLRDIDSAMAFLQRSRSVAGDALQRVDNETGRLATQKLAAKSEQTAAQDLDMVGALSDFQNQQTGYDAALKSYSMVQRMSLFQYLS